MKPVPTRAPTALITGASSGIGESLARIFAQAGHDLVLVARSAGKLEELAEQLAAEHGVKAWAEPCNLAEPEAPARLAAALRRKRRPIDVLVNNAGVLAQGPFAAMKPAAHRQMIDLNVTGLTALIAEFVPAMVERGRGRVLNVASIASFQPVPTLATYAATKAYVLSLTESLAEELKGTGVTITALCPGVTATNMLDSARSANARLGQLPGFLIGDVDDVARLGFEACMKGDVICVPGVVNRAAMIASRSTPKWLVRRIGGVIGRKAL
ncbi:SDR family oxidoreductase [Ramlibacter sp. WS9]|uniref:SDR family NAD(P)-dependent oxidoreductase n=1 Tax=Ramlibacter sp. WS9 TaxID=1882741 RepID=UPI001142D0B7|nr:SDR family oxidoreductase [Ramlibacter sp. WS9]ROZ71240.1 SDR family oxidoreductase [Ramlibacter sp. WS9]